MKTFASIKGVIKLHRTLKITFFKAFFMSYFIVKT
jgi:hypothetical protein